MNDYKNIHNCEICSKEYKDFEVHDCKPTEEQKLKNDLKLVIDALESIETSCPLMEDTDEDLMDGDEWAEILYASTKRRRNIARDALAKLK